MKKILGILALAAVLFSCNTSSKKEMNMDQNQEIEKKANEFASFTLTTDLSVLSEKEKQMLPHLFEAAKVMQEIYWLQSIDAHRKLP